MSEKCLTVIGIGPGGHEDMTIRADRILQEAEVIVGYTVYVELVKEYYPEAEFMTTPMRREAERCRMALNEAAKGRKTALVCSGDSVLYGMAGLTLTLAAEYPEVEVKVIPGISAAFSGSALLGAPITHDTALISLSDLLTPADVIAQRVSAAAEGDFVICFYNPGSRTRKDVLKKACDLILKVRSEDTPCGIARNISREEESVKYLTLSELRDTEVDMFSLVIVGSSSSRMTGGKLVTPRGYREEV